MSKAPSGPESPSSRPSKRRRRRRPRGKGLVLGLVIVAVSALAALAVAGYGLWLWGSAPRAAEGYVEVVLSSSELSQATGALESSGVTDSAWRLGLYARSFGSELEIEPGRHWLWRGSSPRELMRLLARRQDRPVRTVGLPEGWDSFQIAERLAREGICSASAFLAAAHDVGRARASLAATSFEGYLYPATYELRLNSDPVQLVDKFANQARLRFAPALGDQARLLERGLSAASLVTLASIVQKEAADAAEMPLVASVFFNRLTDPEFRPQQMLQSDPTAGYGCKLPDAPASCAGFDGRITPALLRDPSNRYNTYKRRGLPPGPIANPSAAALQATLNAPPSKYYFFVLGADGRHHFSESLREHQQATR